MPQCDQQIIVVGSGPCAAVAARELVLAGRDVTMLDAGHRAPRGMLIRVGGHSVFRVVEPGYIELNRQRSATDSKTEWSSSHSLGGLTNYWTGAVPRFSPDDFTDGARLDELFDWPIRYDELVPYYEIIEDDLQITAGEPFSNIPPGRSAHRWDPPSDWRGLVADVARNGDCVRPAPIAKGSPWMVAMRPREFTSYHCIVRPLLRSPNFQLITDARVLRVNLDPVAGCANSVVYFDRRSRAVVTAPARAVVIAAGSVDSTEILLRSVSDAFPTGLGNTHDLLGRYLHDHPREWWPVQLDRPLTAVNHPMVISREPFDSSPPLLAASLTIGLASGRDRLREIAGRNVRRLGVQVLGTMIPSPDQRITLAPGRDADDPRSVVEIDLRFDESAVGTLLRARQRYEAVFAAAGRPVRIGPFHDLAPGSSTHLGGTVRMHRRPDFGVIDEWNRVHDVPNVVVCDASCFTTGPEKNPTLTAMAIAARAGRRLAQDTA